MANSSSEVSSARYGRPDSSQEVPVLRIVPAQPHPEPIETSRISIPGNLYLVTRLWRNGDGEKCTRCAMGCSLWKVDDDLSMCHVLDQSQFSAKELLNGLSCSLLD